MSQFFAGRRIAVSGVITSLLFAVPVWAQESGQSQSEGMRQSTAEAEMDPTYVSPYVWNVGVGVGTVSGANPVGSIIDDEEEKIFTFDIGDGFLISGRAARRLWWRLGAEVEGGYSSPGVLVTETDLAGQSLTTSDFGDYSFGYVSVSARIDLTDARVTPFLLGGFAVVFASVPENPDDPGNTSEVNPGFIFGGGLDVRIKDNINLRGDVKGLRSNIDAPLLSRGILIPNEELGDALSTQVLWTIGVAVRF